MRLLPAIALLLQLHYPSGPHTESAHVAGPNGLSGWTLDYKIEDYGNLPMTLVIARHGHIVRRIHGDGFVWDWMFTPDGKRVIYKSGPMHFVMTCYLADIRSGKVIDSYDCFSDDLTNAPDWVKKFESQLQQSSK